MRCVTADLHEADNSWHFRELDTKEHGHWLKRLRVWRQLDDHDRALCVVLDELIVTWEQNHELQTLVLYMRGGTRLDCVIKLVTGGTLDPSFCWLGAMVVAPNARGRGLGTYYWALTRALIKRSHPRVQRVALTPLEQSKRFWRERCGFKPLPEERNKLAGVIPTLGGPNSPFADAPLLGVEVYELSLVDEK